MDKNKNKKIVIGIICFLAIYLVGAASYYLIVMEITYPVIPETSKKPEEVVLQPKYQVFQPGINNKEIIESAYLRITDVFPKNIKLGDAELIVKEVNIDKNPVNNGVMAYLTVSYGGKDQKVGFWHPGDLARNEFLKTNACAKGNNSYDYVCGGILVIRVREWNRTPTEEEKSQGIINVFYLERVFLQELDYDYVSGNWNYAKIVLGLYEEKQHPFTTDK